MWSHKRSVSSQYGVSIYSLAIQAANVANVLWFGQAAADLHRKLISQIYKHAAQSGSRSTSAPWRSSGWRVHLCSIRTPIHSLCRKDGDHATCGPPASDYICRVPRPRPPPPKHQPARQVAHLYTLKEPNISRLDLAGLFDKGRCWEGEGARGALLSG